MTFYWFLVFELNGWVNLFMPYIGWIIRRKMFPSIVHPAEPLYLMAPWISFRVYFFLLLSLIYASWNMSRNLICCLLFTLNCSFALVNLIWNLWLSKFDFSKALLVEEIVNSLWNCTVWKEDALVLMSWLVMSVLFILVDLAWRDVHNSFQIEILGMKRLLNIWGISYGNRKF